MSIQSSVNALIGSIGAIRRARDLATMRKAEISIEQQKLAQKQQKLNTESKLAEASLARASTQAYKAKTERKALNAQLRKEKEDGTKAL